MVGFCSHCGEALCPNQMHVCAGSLTLSDGLIAFEEADNPVHRTMKLWAIRRNDATYDEFDVCVVRAETEQEARKMASWESFESSEISKCTELKPEGVPEVLFCAVIGCGWEKTIAVEWRDGR